MSKRKQYTAEDLYTTNERPSASDIDQDKLHNCYFLAPIGALAEQQPDRIRDAIRFDPSTGEFTVRLYRPPNTTEGQAGQTAPIEEFIIVSQDDLRRNIEKEKGGSTLDNNRDRSGALWPAVLEAAMAELYGRDSRGQSNLKNGYELIGDATRGGSLSDGMYALTGDAGRNIQIPTSDGRKSVNQGPAHVPRPEPAPFKAPSLGYKLSVGDAHIRVEQALAAGQPVSLATQGRKVNDGLMDSHAYTVIGISKHAHTGDTLLRLRNPYGHNQVPGEGNHNIGSGWKDTNPEITISLNEIVRKGSFGEFNIGPAPRVQTQSQSVAPQTPQPQSDAPAAEPSASVQPVAAPLLSDPTHPAHDMYAQTLRAFAASSQIAAAGYSEERQQLMAANLVAGMASMPQSRNLNGLTQEKLHRVDAATIASDGSYVTIIQRAAQNSTSFRFGLPMEQAHSGSIETA